jgi:hypothetical protein
MECPSRTMGTHPPRRKPRKLDMAATNLERTELTSEGKGFD